LLADKEIITNTLYASIFSSTVSAVRINILATQALTFIRIGGVIKARGTLVCSRTGLAFLIESSTFEASLSLEIILIIDAFGTFIHTNTGETGCHHSSTVITIILFDIELIIAFQTFIFGTLLTVLSVNVTG
jgi:hypothetical protein